MIFNFPPGASLWQWINETFLQARLMAGGSWEGEMQLEMLLLPSHSWVYLLKSLQVHPEVSA